MNGTAASPSVVGVVGMGGADALAAHGIAPVLAQVAGRAARGAGSRTGAAVAHAA